MQLGSGFDEVEFMRDMISISYGKSYFPCVPLVHHALETPVVGRFIGKGKVLYEPAWFI